MCGARSIGEYTQRWQEPSVAVVAVASNQSWHLPRGMNILHEIMSALMQVAHNSRTYGHPGLAG